jgi:hypothetical protein
MYKQLESLVQNNSLRLGTQDRADAQTLCKCGFEAAMVRQLPVPKSGASLKGYTLVSCGYKAGAYSR